MSSAAATAMDVADLRVPSDDELSRELRDLAPAMYLYSAAPEWFIFEHGGHFFHLPPDVGGKLVPHPWLREKGEDGTPNAGAPVMVKGDGRLAVRDIWGVLRDQFGKITQVAGQLQGQEAASIIRFAATVYHSRGVIWLRGNDTDAGRIRAAKKLYRQHIRAWAEEEVQARAAFVSNWKKQAGNEGRTPPPPNEKQNAAQEILDELVDEGRKGTEYICEYGCYETADFEKYQRHMRVRHKKTIKAPTVAALVEEAASQAGRMSADATTTVDGTPVEPGKKGKGEGGGSAKRK